MRLHNIVLLHLIMDHFIGILQMLKHVVHKCRHRKIDISLKCIGSAVTCQQKSTLIVDITY